jgi:hypothetical protein
MIAYYLDIGKGFRRGIRVKFESFLNVREKGGSMRSFEVKVGTKEDVGE